MNWQNIISEMQARQVRQSAMAAECKCSQALISALLTGAKANPSYTIGTALLAMHKRVMRRKEK